TGAGAPSITKPLAGDARILHALNRFTFGPRPGDLEAVRAEGLDTWFDQQLHHPAKIDETNLNARLAQFPAMQWSPAELLYRVPSNAIIRQTLDGKLPVPERGALHAVYENQMYRVSEKRQQKEQNKADAKARPQQATNETAAMTAPNSGSGDDSQAPMQPTQPQPAMDAHPPSAPKTAPSAL